MSIAVSERIQDKDIDDQVEVAIIGGGVVGLALFRLLTQTRETVLFEAQEQVGMGISSRSSEVIHAGLYNPPSSLKSRLCVQGSSLLYEYCQQKEVPAQKIGKLIVATSEEEEKSLLALKKRAEQNGINDLVLLSQQEARQMEPELKCHSALYSPSTGIIDSHQLMQSFKNEAIKNQGYLMTSTVVVAGEKHEEGVVLVVEQEEREAINLLCSTVINAAGLQAQAVSRSIQGVAPGSIPEQHLVKGHYYALQGPSPFSRLIYPLPEAGGLGIHSTLDLSGKTRFGPDAITVEEESYDFNDDFRDKFAHSIRRYFPDLDEQRLQPDYTGIRPKIFDTEDAWQDFEIQGEESHGVPGLFNLYGIESPGLTACMAIALYVNSLAEKQ